MECGLKFTESEANEILRLAVQMAAPDKIGRDELAIVAAQLGISPEGLASAEEQHERLKTEAGEREAFHGLQVSEFKLFAFYWVGLLLIESVAFLALKDTFPLYLYSFVILLVLGYHARRMLSPKSEKYKADFEEWRYLRRFRASMMDRLGIVDRVVAESLQKQNAPSLFQLRLAVKRNLLCDWRRATEAVDEYLRQNPEVAQRIRGAR